MYIVIRNQSTFLSSLISDRPTVLLFSDVKTASATCWNQRSGLRVLCCLCRESRTKDHRTKNHRTKDHTDKRPPGQKVTKLVCLRRNLKSPDCVFFYSRAGEKNDKNDVVCLCCCSLL